MSFGQAELKQLIQERITSLGINPWEYAILESKDLEESATEWPTGQLEDGKGRLTEEDEEELEEVSSMAGGAVAGAPGGAWGQPEDDVVVADKWAKLREVIRKLAIDILKENTQNYLLQETKLRKYIRSVLLTEKSNVTANPHHMTGINVLQHLLANIIPGAVEPDYKSLTTSPEQREGYRTQLKHSIENLLNQAGMNKIAGTDQDGDGDLDEVGEQSPEETESPVQPLKVVDDANPFIDVYGDDKGELGEFQQEEPTAQPEDDGILHDVDATGRGKALETFNQIQKQITAEFSKLSDQRDIEAFSKYLMINLDMYMDKFEDEVSQSLSQIDASPGPEDVVDAGDGLSGDEMDAGGPADDPFMPDDLEKEWKDAEGTVVEFYSTAGTNTSMYGYGKQSEPEEDDLAHFPHR